MQLRRTYASLVLVMLMAALAVGPAVSVTAGAAPSPAIQMDPDPSADNDPPSSDFSSPDSGTHGDLLSAVIDRGPASRAAAGGTSREALRLPASIALRM